MAASQPQGNCVVVWFEGPLADFVAVHVEEVLRRYARSLSPDEKDLLQTLAVIGREFSLSVLKAVVSKPEGRQTGDTAFRCDCLLERSRLEPSVSREVFPRENTRQCWGNFVSKSAGILQRMSSPSVRDVAAVQPQNSGVARMQMKVQGLRIR